MSQYSYDFDQNGKTTTVVSFVLLFCLGFTNDCITGKMTLCQLNISLEFFFPSCSVKSGQTFQSLKVKELFCEAVFLSSR
mgnify:CR=1 FL=1